MNEQIKIFELFVLTNIAGGNGQCDFTGKYEDAETSLIALGLLTHGRTQSVITDKGWLYLQMLTNTPLPVNRWYDPRTKEE